MAVTDVVMAIPIDDEALKKLMNPKMIFHSSEKNGLVIKSLKMLKLNEHDKNKLF